MIKPIGRRHFIKTAAIGTAAGYLPIVRGSTENIQAPEIATDRIDEHRRQHIRDICEYVLSRLDKRGRFLPEEALYAESIGYRSSLGAYLAEVGWILGEPQFVEAAGAILRDVLSDRIDGMWPIGAAPEYPLYRGLPVGWRDMYLRQPHLAYTALTVSALGAYYRASGDTAVIDPARQALEKMIRHPDFELPKESLTGEFVGMAFSAWEKSLPEFAAFKAPFVQWALDTFLETAPSKFPFVTMYRTMFLINETGSQYLNSHIKPAIDAMLEEPRWRCPENPRDFFHIRDTADHVNIRGNGAVAITMRLFDLAAGRQVYTGGEVYRHVAGWIDGQRREDGAFFGCREHGMGRHYSLGSPDQYLVLSWLTGGLGKI